MNAAPRKKLCWNCEGRVSFQEENCPFCGVYLSPEEMHQEEDLASSNVALDSDQENPSQNNIPLELDEEKEASHSFTLLSLSLLLLGSVLFMFAIVLFTFSKEGTLTLQWDTTYWYLYFLVASLFLYVGFKFLQKT